MFICACTKKRRDRHDLEKKRCPFGMQEFQRNCTGIFFEQSGGAKAPTVKNLLKITHRNKFNIKTQK